MPGQIGLVWLGRGLGVEEIDRHPDESPGKVARDLGVFLVSRQLEHQGHRVQSFLSPLEALSAIEREPYAFDVLVTDYNMPKLSGVKLLEAARRLRSDVPVILTSGFISDEMRVVAERSGASCLIHKPDTDDELCEAISRVAAELP